MIDKFSDRFCHCNPKLGLDKGKNLMGIVIYMTKWVLILYFSVVVDENGQGYFSSQYELVPSECKLNLVKGSLEYLLSMFHIMSLFQLSMLFALFHILSMPFSDTVFVLCFSLIMLSVDLSSPAVKNKMSKREFIKNTRRAARSVDDDLAGDLYDNIYLIGHVATDSLR